MMRQRFVAFLMIALQAAAMEYIGTTLKEVFPVKVFRDRGEAPA